MKKNKKINGYKRFSSEKYFNWPAIYREREEFLNMSGRIKKYLNSIGKKI